MSIFKDRKTANGGWLEKEKVVKRYVYWVVGYLTVANKEFNYPLTGEAALDHPAETGADIKALGRQIGSGTRVLVTFFALLREEGS